MDHKGRARALAEGWNRNAFEEAFCKAFKLESYSAELGETVSRLWLGLLKGKKSAVKGLVELFESRGKEAGWHDANPFIDAIAPLGFWLLLESTRISREERKQSTESQLVLEGLTELFSTRPIGQMLNQETLKNHRRLTGEDPSAASFLALLRHHILLTPPEYVKTHMRNTRYRSPNSYTKALISHASSVMEQLDAFLQSDHGQAKQTHYDSGSLQGKDTEGVTRVQVLERLSITRHVTCRQCGRNDDKFHFHCNIEDGPVVVMCGACLHEMAQQTDSFALASLPGAEGIGPRGIKSFLVSQYGEKRFSNNWEFAKAVLLPHQETNQNEKDDGEWIFTVALDKDGEILAENTEGQSMGIYPNQETAKREIVRYLRSKGAKTICFDFLHLDPDIWSDIKDLLRSPYGEHAWTIFARSKSNEDVRKYIINVRKSLASAKLSF